MVYQAQHCQESLSREVIILLCTAVASPQIWCADLGATIQEGYKTVRQHPEERYGDSEGSTGEAM